MKRFKQLLLMPSRSEQSVRPADPKNGLEITGSFQWGKQLVKFDAAEGAADAPPGTDQAGASARTDAVGSLSDISLAVETGELVGVCGTVGSGKTSLLMAALRLMPTVGDTARVALGGSVAYVSQQAWIQSATLQANILFGKALDPVLYAKVVDICCLQADIEMLPGGDQTEIGERGLNLSGGQKQRVALARAVYAERDIYMLDDPLSAVDAHVGKRIFEECITKHLGGRTVVFVTHQLQYLPACDRVAFMDRGAIEATQPYEDILQSNAKFAEFIDSLDRVEDEPGAPPNDTPTLRPTAAQNVAPRGGGTLAPSATTPAVNTTSVNPSAAPASAAAASALASQVQSEGAGAGSAPSSAEQPPAAAKGGAAGALVTAETTESGAVSAATFAAYARAGGGVVVFALIACAFFCAMGVKVFTDEWLAEWVNSGNGTGEGSMHDNPDQDYYVAVYACGGVGFLLLHSLRGFVYNRQMLHASSTLHNTLMGKIMRAPMSFFDTTPTGRIMARISKDLDETDVRLPMIIEQSLNFFSVIAISLCLVAYIFPYFLVSTPVIATMYWYIVKRFLPAQRSTKRLENGAASPVINHLTSTLHGLPLVHAFDARDVFNTRFMDLLDIQSRALFSFFALQSWAAWRLDFCSLLILGTTAFMVPATHGRVSPGLTGLALVYANNLIGIFQAATRMMAETLARFTSVERIVKYIGIVPSESPEGGGPRYAVKSKDPSALQGTAWPHRGAIAFDNVSVRYRPGLPDVLKNVSLDIQSTEKIGIVGRTGSGKSSLALCLFRMMDDHRGTITIDGIDIATLGLDAVRSSIAIIPQDPVLFMGTIRYNLDPFGRSTDEQLWAALHKAHVAECVRRLPGQLAAQVAENGNNLSVGERQLICMARVLLRGSKIMILDEATAAIDTQTDALIQRTIREEFAACTVLTVAHRLNTILDSDRILVLGAGEVLEFDTPARLQFDPASHLSRMLQSSSSQRAAAHAHAHA